MKLFPYLYAYFRYPELRDYIDMGLGIEARYLRCKPFWKRHLELSKEFQARCFSRVTDRSTIAILGAGRLLDVNTESLLAQFDAIHLVDADPLACTAWKRLRLKVRADQRVVAHTRDITGSIATWTRNLEVFLKSSPKADIVALAAFLRDLRPLGAHLDQYQVVVSLNLLSQIGIYWKDRVENLLAKVWGLHSNERGYFEAQLQAALDESLRRLEKQHLELLAESGADFIVVLTDQNFLYYTKDRSEWQAEAALKSPDLEMRGYSVCDRDTWFWHIAPQDIEQADYGAIHQVTALCFKRT